MLEEASRLTESVEIKEELIDVEDDTVESVSVESFDEPGPAPIKQSKTHM